MRDGVEPLHRSIDVAQAVKLRAARGANQVCLAGDFANAGIDGGQRIGRLADQPHTRAHLRRGALDQSLHFGSGAGAPLRERAHLGCHHGKAAARLAGAGRLDSRVQRENIGLKSDAVDHADDVRHLVGALREPLYGLYGRFHGGFAAVGRLAHLLCQRTGRACIARVDLHRPDEIGHIPRRLRQIRRLFVGAVRKRPGAHQQLVAGHRHEFGFTANARHEGRELPHHRVHAAPGFGQFVTTGHSQGQLQRPAHLRTSTPRGRARAPRPARSCAAARAKRPL